MNGFILYRGTPVALILEDLITQIKIPRRFSASLAVQPGVEQCEAIPPCAMQGTLRCPTLTPQGNGKSQNSRSKTIIIIIIIKY